MYHFLRSVNWRAITSWDELEKAIVALPDQGARGDAFEEFCHALLTLRRDFYQVRGVWRFSDAPSEVLQRLGCVSRQDEGIDGILLHHDATLTTYQAKFRSDRSDIPTQRELSTFFMVSDKADYRLIISNVEDLPRVVRERKDHGQILIDHLLDLEPEFFACLQQYVCESQVRPEPRPTPRPFQAEAIRAIVEGFKECPRGQAIVACGAGKTLIGKWNFTK